MGTFLSKNLTRVAFFLDFFYLFREGLRFFRKGLRFFMRVFLGTNFYA